MITLTYKDIRQGFFLQAFDRLCNNPNLGPKVSYNVSKIASKVRPQVETCQEKFVELVKKYAILDDKGNIKPINGPGSYEVRPEALEEYKKDLKSFENTTFTIDRFKLTYKDLEKANLAPNEWLGLEPLIVEMEAVETTKTG